MLPPHVAALADELAALPGAAAVVLGGSRATGTHLAHPGATGAELAAGVAAVAEAIGVEPLAAR
ncbi:MAG TPA: hypothetical protein VGF25_14125 [Thermoleophilaceae bacterium]|jgi:hypothetical protein